MARKGCFQRANLRKMKAIHNKRAQNRKRSLLFPKSKFTKNESNSQLISLLLLRVQQLFPKSKFTKNESNSQRRFSDTFSTSGCFQRANLRKMKAIHNTRWDGLKRGYAVSKEQIYEKWKQFTTRLIFNWINCGCFQRANLRKMKAIHNKHSKRSLVMLLFPKSKFTKNESNSQHFLCYF